MQSQTIPKETFIIVIFWGMIRGYDSHNSNILPLLKSTQVKKRHRQLQLQPQPQPLYITLHYTTVTALHYTALHFTTLNYTTRRYNHNYNYNYITLH